MDGFRKSIVALALLVIIAAFTAPALAQMRGAPMAPMASPTMMPTAMPTMMPTMGQGMQGGMMPPMQMTTSNKDMMSTLQGMVDMKMTMSVLKAAGVESMMSGKQITMFVPGDMAMQKMGMDKINMIVKDKQMAMNMMKGLTMDRMMMPSDMTDGKTLTMMDGKTMTVKMTNGQMMVDGAKVMKAVQTSNGMIYIIDNMPSSMMGMMQTGAGSMGTVPMSK